MRTKLTRIKISDDYHDFLNITDILKENEKKLKIVCDSIVRKFCPYKKGMRIIYRVHGDPYSKHAIIKDIKFNPGNGVDGVWETMIVPTNKKFEPFMRKIKIWLNDKDDRIVKIADNKKSS